MTPTIKPDVDLDKTVYKPGQISEAGGQDSYSSGVGASNVPRTSDDLIHQAKDVDKHFKQIFNPLSFSLVEARDNKVTKLLEFQPAGGKNDIVYLPYYDNCITSTIIPTNDPSVSYFITDTMSGCNFFIDRLENKDLVCYHANARQYSTAKEELKTNAAAFNQKAVDKMNELHQEARGTYNRAQTVAELRVKDYYSSAQDWVNEKGGKGCTDVEFSGGCTIMGFSIAGKWEFWFQTHGRLKYRPKPTLIDRAFKGKDKEIPPVEGKYKVIHSECFWRA